MLVLRSIVLSIVVVAVIAFDDCPYGQKAVADGSGSFSCKQACAKGYYSSNGVHPCGSVRGR